MKIDKMTQGQVIEASINHLRDLYFTSKVWVVFNESSENPSLQFNITENIKWIVRKVEGGWYLFQIYFVTKNKKLQVSKEHPTQMHDLITATQSKRELVDLLDELTRGTKVFLETSPLIEHTGEDFRLPLVKRANGYLERRAQDIESEKENKKAVERETWKKDQAEKAAKEKSNNQKLWWGIAFFVFWLVVFVLSPGDGCYSTYDGEMVCN